jgi:purine-binding chemotaxis protein CheW
MSAIIDSNKGLDRRIIQLATFRVGEVLMGVDISRVQEINRHCDVTKVPRASEKIHGVVNLRGDVVTVLNPHQILGLQESGDPTRKRNLILNIEGERVGVLVDQVADIITVREDELVPRPANVPSIDRQFIESVCLREEDVVVVLDATQLLDLFETST